MKKSGLLTTWILLALAVFANAETQTAPANGKLKIFILAGQSNMVGFGQVKGSPGTMESYVKSYEIVGFGWHQGWNDRIDQKAVDAYEKNLENLIHDLRKDLGVEKLPFVVANTGMGGWDIVGSYKAKVEKLMEAQLAVADPEKYPAFKGNVAGVETRGFQRSREESPSKQDFHWLRNWETLYLIGKGMGDSMVGLLTK